jgi:hypothetical protein
MSETVGQHSVAAFTSPVNGTSPIDANTVKGNDNTLRSAYVDHDADPGIHVQSSTLASRPVANSAGRKWMTQDSGVIRLFYDDGTSWYEVDYLRTTGGTISGNLAVTGTLAVTGVATFTAQPVLSSLTASQAVFTDASKGLVSNAITGTGSVVMSASPTLTGTITAAAATLSGALGVSGLLTFASLKGTGTTTVTNILDEDNMASDSATALATQQSIKAYVDAQVGASDALSEVLAIGNTTGANDIIVSAGQKIRTPAVAAQDGSSAITIANTTGALTLATGLADSNLATISTAGKVSNSATTATSANTASAIVARDASGNFTAGTVTAALSGNASTATTLQTARTINGVSFNGSADITVTAAAGTLTGSTLASGVTASSLTSVGTLANLTVTNPISGSVTGSSGSTTGNAATATALQTARSINGVSFNGTADITVTAAAGTLSGSTLASGVTASSLTSVGTLSSLTVSGDLTVDTNTLKVNSSTDKVGIGTTSMVSKLDVRLSGTSSGGVVGVGNAGTGDFGGLGISDGGTYPVELWGSSLSFKTGNSAYASATEKMVLTSAGNLAVDTNTLYVDATNDSVGIGTTSPSHKLHVSGGKILVDNNQAIASLDSAGTSRDILRLNASNELEVAPAGAVISAVTFKTVGVERMRLDSSGNVGIGTSSPASGGGGGLTLGTTSSGKSLHIYSSSYANNGLANFYGTDGNMKLQMGALGATSAYIYANTGCSLALYSGGNLNATLDASGNLGLGVTPSAWSASFKALQVSGLGALWGSSTGFFMSNNTYNDGSNKYIGNGLATRYYQSTGQHIWENAPNNTSGAGAACTLTQAMTLDASGNLGVGATSSSVSFDTGTSGTARVVSRLDSTGTTRTTQNPALLLFNGGTVTQNQMARIAFSSGSGALSNVIGADITAIFTGDGTGNGRSTALVFSTADQTVAQQPTERARITSGGDLQIGGTNGTYQVNITQSAGDMIRMFRDTSNTVEMFTTSSSTNIFYITVDNSQGVSLTSGNTSWGSYSDARLKNVTGTYDNAIADVCQLEPVKFTWKSDEANKPHVGLLAQSVEPVIPEAVDTDENGMMSVRYTEIIPLLVAAIKELTAKNEALEARLAALEA